VKAVSRVSGRGGCQTLDEASLGLAGLLRDGARRRCKQSGDGLRK